MITQTTVPGARRSGGWNRRAWSSARARPPGRPMVRMTWNVLPHYLDGKPFEGQQADA
jgi:hypothetical protein